MRIAVCSDEPYPVQQTIVAALRAAGHEVVPFGAVADGKEAPWVEVAERAGRAVADGQCEEGVFSCWSGTGICMAANKLPGIRAALCFDAATAKAARTWNHANVLCLSNRMLSDDVATEILSAWFERYSSADGSAGVQLMQALDVKYRRS